MSDADTIEESLERIRNRRRKQLLATLGGRDDAAPASSSPVETPTTPETPIHIDSVDHFSELIGSDSVVLVDFYATWCGPCQQLGPVIEAVAAETEAAVAKVDIDRLQPLAQQYDVRGVPTLVLFSDGDPVERVVGFTPKAQLTALVDRYS